MFDVEYVELGATQDQIDNDEWLIFISRLPDWTLAERIRESLIGDGLVMFARVVES